jgi:VID27 C-terminal WD40-like domain
MPCGFIACIVPAGDGCVVVGSEDGKIRLYSSSTLTQAKTAIPGLGAAITAVDVTFDGNWVLATTNKYLMVVKTVFRDKSGRQGLRFLGVLIWALCQEKLGDI